jgi:hypothetical protein
MDVCDLISLAISFSCRRDNILSNYMLGLVLTIFRKIPYDMVK